MKLLRAILALGLAGLTVGAASGRAYLPAVGPVPLRFAAPLASLSQAVLPPLVMVTRPPVDTAGTNELANAGGWPLAPGGGTNGPIVFGASSVPAAPPNPYDQGLVPPAEGGSWPAMYFSVTNGPGMLSVPIAPPVNFAPPSPAPQSRATYTITP